MARYINAGDETVVFRDDRPGKQYVAPGKEFDLVGDQHAPVIEAIPGVERARPAPRAEAAPATPERPPTVAELRARAEGLGLDVPSNARRADLEAAIATHEADHGGTEPADDPSASSDGEAGGRP